MFFLRSLFSFFYWFFFELQSFYFMRFFFLLNIYFFIPMLFILFVEFMTDDDLFFSIFNLINMIFNYLGYFLLLLFFWFFYFFLIWFFLINFFLWPSSRLFLWLFYIFHTNDQIMLSCFKKLLFFFFKFLNKDAYFLLWIFWDLFQC